MTSAYILIVATLILGGLIAALGDRLGTKIGKARLRLFNLRPRQTAIVVTVATGILIVASTLGILLALSKSLRQGLFELDDILAKRRSVTAELNRVKLEKEQVESVLIEAKNKQKTVQRQLDATNQNYQRANRQLVKISKLASSLNSEIKTLSQERQELVKQRLVLAGQIQNLQEQINSQDTALVNKEKKIVSQDNLLKIQQYQFKNIREQKAKLQLEVNKRDQYIASLDQEISQKNQDLTAREKRLKILEEQQTFLEREVQTLEQYYQNYQDLREKNIAILRGQVLAIGALKVLESNAVLTAIDQLLIQANKRAITAIKTGETQPETRVVQITKAQVEQLAKQIEDGKEYVIRILSGGNYVQGEKEVRVFADVVLNQQIFQAGDTLATVSLDQVKISDEDIQKQIDSLIVAAQFKARTAGILGNIQVEDGRIRTLVDFINTVSNLDESLDQIKVIVPETTYTVGPLKLRLVVTRNGKTILETN